MVFFRPTEMEMIKLSLSVGSDSPLPARARFRTRPLTRRAQFNLFSVLIYMERARLHVAPRAARVTLIAYRAAN